MKAAKRIFLQNCNSDPIESKRKKESNMLSNHLYTSAQPPGNACTIQTKTYNYYGSICTVTHRPGYLVPLHNNGTLCGHTLHCYQNNLSLNECKYLTMALWYNLSPWSLILTFFLWEKLRKLFSRFEKSWFSVNLAKFSKKSRKSHWKDCFKSTMYKRKAKIRTWQEYFSTCSFVKTHGHYTNGAPAFNTPGVTRIVTHLNVP